MLFDIYIRGSTKNLKEVEQKRVSYSSSEPRLSEDVNHRSVLGYVHFICFYMGINLRDLWELFTPEGILKNTSTHAPTAQINVQDHGKFSRIYKEYSAEQFYGPIKTLSIINDAAGDSV